LEFEAMSTIVKADAQGAVTLPAEFCKEAGIAPESELILEIQTDRIIVALAHSSLAERIAVRARSLPQETLDRLPADGASQHDHYIYGTPKRPE
jgi:bifunctional DNA-binding transcriptional regulator/antitoxin component of YhaV-PrlF toxin-antitoxin module